MSRAEVQTQRYISDYKAKRRIEENERRAKKRIKRMKNALYITGFICIAFGGIGGGIGGAVMLSLLVTPWLLIAYLPAAIFLYIWAMNWAMDELLDVSL